jgi:hypothetical protein
MAKYRTAQSPTYIDDKIVIVSESPIAEEGPLENQGIE